VLPSFTIDAHHHLWRYTPAEFGWIDDSMARLRQDFLSPQLDDEVAASGISQTVAVQARPSLEENDFLLASAAQSAHVAGVVGWAPLCDDHLTELLEPYTDEPVFVGIREMVQAEAAGYLDQPAFDRGLRELTVRDLSYDLLLRRNQLPEATRLVSRHPAQRFVLDHAAKPNIQGVEFEPWASDVRDLAQRDNVTCKISGLITEADWAAWTLDDLRPYLDLCVDAFGPARLMAGSDWPVYLVAAESSRWWATLDEYFSNFTTAERDHIFARTAQDFYRLNRGAV
jgi:L-fuconolactonase